MYNAIHSSIFQNDMSVRYGLDKENIYIYSFRDWPSFVKSGISKNNLQRWICVTAKVRGRICLLEKKPDTDPILVKQPGSGSYLILALQKFIFFFFSLHIKINIIDIYYNFSNLITESRTNQNIRSGVWIPLNMVGIRKSYVITW